MEDESSMSSNRSGISSSKMSSRHDNCNNHDDIAPSVGSTSVGSISSMASSNSFGSVDPEGYKFQRKSSLEGNNNTNGYPTCPDHHNFSRSSHRPMSRPNRPDSSPQVSQVLLPLPSDNGQAQGKTQSQQMLKNAVFMQVPTNDGSTRPPSKPHRPLSRSFSSHTDTRNTRNSRNVQDAQDAQVAHGSERVPRGARNSMRSNLSSSGSLGSEASSDSMPNGSVGSFGIVFGSESRGGSKDHKDRAGGAGGIRGRGFRGGSNSDSSVSSFGSVGKSLFESEELWNEFKMELEQSQIKTTAGFEVLLQKFLLEQQQGKKNFKSSTSHECAADAYGSHGTTQGMTDKREKHSVKCSPKVEKNNDWRRSGGTRSQLLGAFSGDEQVDESKNGSGGDRLDRRKRSESLGARRESSSRNSTLPSRMRRHSTFGASLVQGILKPGKTGSNIYDNSGFSTGINSDINNREFSRSQRRVSNPTHSSSTSSSYGDNKTNLVKGLSNSLIKSFTNGMGADDVNYKAFSTELWQQRPHEQHSLGPLRRESYKLIIRGDAEYLQDDSGNVSSGPTTSTTSTTSSAAATTEDRETNKSILGWMGLCSAVNNLEKELDNAVDNLEKELNNCNGDAGVNAHHDKTMNETVAGQSLKPDPPVEREESSPMEGLGENNGLGLYHLNHIQVPNPGMAVYAPKRTLKKKNKDRKRASTLGGVAPNGNVLSSQKENFEEKSKKDDLMSTKEVDPKSRGVFECTSSSANSQISEPYIEKKKKEAPSSDAVPKQNFNRRNSRVFKAGTLLDAQSLGGDVSMISENLGSIDNEDITMPDSDEINSKRSANCRTGDGRERETIKRRSIDQKSSRTCEPRSILKPQAVVDQDSNDDKSMNSEEHLIIMEQILCVPSSTSSTASLPSDSLSEANDVQDTANIQKDSSPNQGIKPCLNSKPRYSKCFDSNATYSTAGMTMENETVSADETSRRKSLRGHRGNAYAERRRSSRSSGSKSSMPLKRGSRTLDLLHMLASMESEKEGDIASNDDDSYLNPDMNLFMLEKKVMPRPSCFDDFDEDDLNAELNPDVLNFALDRVGDDSSGKVKGLDFGGQNVLMETDKVDDAVDNLEPECLDLSGNSIVDLSGLLDTAGKIGGPAFDYNPCLRTKSKRERKFKRVTEADKDSFSVESDCKMPAAKCSTSFEYIASQCPPSSDSDSKHQSLGEISNNICLEKTCHSTSMLSHENTFASLTSSITTSGSIQVGGELLVEWGDTSFDDDEDKDNTERAVREVVYFPWPDKNDSRDDADPEDNFLQKDESEAQLPDRNQIEVSEGSYERDFVVRAETGPAKKRVSSITLPEAAFDTIDLEILNVNDSQEENPIRLSSCSDNDITFERPDLLRRVSGVTIFEEPDEDNSFAN